MEVLTTLYMTWMNDLRLCQIEEAENMYHPQVEGCCCCIKEWITFPWTCVTRYWQCSKSETELSVSRMDISVSAFLKRWLSLRLPLVEASIFCTLFCFPSVSIYYHHWIYDIVSRGIVSLVITYSEELLGRRHSSFFSGEKGSFSHESKTLISLRCPA